MLSLLLLWFHYQDLLSIELLLEFSMQKSTSHVYVPELAEVMQTMGDVLSIEETEEFVHEVWFHSGPFLP